MCLCVGVRARARVCGWACVVDCCFVIHQLGVRLEDTSGATRWKLDDPAVLLAEIAAKREAAAAKIAQKKAKAIKRLQASIAEVRALRFSPQ